MPFFSVYDWWRPDLDDELGPGPGYEDADMPAPCELCTVELPEGAGPLCELCAEVVVS
jgi:hypothetical protein